MTEIDRMESRPILTRRPVPRRDLSWLFYLLAALSCGALAAARWLERRYAPRRPAALMVNDMRRLDFLPCWLGSRLRARRELRNVLIVLDVTRSINVRDMDGRSRLHMAQEVLTGWIASQPCSVRVGLGFFTERRSLTLIKPVEICSDYSALTGALSGLEWRMVWEGASDLVPSA